MGFLFRLLSVFFRSPAVEPDVRLKESDIVGSHLSVVHTPGHTSGSISLYDQGRKLVFVGDAITNRGGSLQGSPKQFTVDMHQANKSIQRYSTLDFEVLMSGHGDVVKSGGTQKVRELVASLKL